MLYQRCCQMLLVEVVLWFNIISFKWTKHALCEFLLTFCLLKYLYKHVGVFIYNVRELCCKYSRLESCWEPIFVKGSYCAKTKEKCVWTMGRVFICFADQIVSASYSFFCLFSIFISLWTSLGCNTLLPPLSLYKTK